jgi:hypothetical protein
LRDLSAQRVALKQLERYLGASIGPDRKNFVGLTNTNGDQEYKKLDSIIVSITDSLIALNPDTDEQKIDTAFIVDNILYLSLERDDEPAHQIDLSTFGIDAQTLSYNHATNTLSISNGNSVTNFEQAWQRSVDTLHPTSNGDNISRNGRLEIGYIFNGSNWVPTWDESQLRVRNESRIDWLGLSTNKPSGFGQRFFEVNELSDFIYRADLRFTVTLGGVSGSYEKLFNGDFSIPYNVTGGSPIYIDLTHGLEAVSSVTYPEGYLYIHFYSVPPDPGTITVLCNYASSTVDVSSTVVNIATNKESGYQVLRYKVLDNNYLTGFTITFDNTVPVTEIAYTMTRAGELEEPFVGKFKDNNLVTKLTFKDKVGDRQSDNGTYGQIFMSKVDSVEWADFSAIPGITTFITHLADSVDTDTDTDRQWLDTAYILNDTLILSIWNDDSLAKRINLKPYLDNSDVQYADTFVIVANQLRHSLIRDSIPYQSVDLSPYLDNTDNQVIDTFVIVGDSLRISLSGDGQPYKWVDLRQYIDTAFADTDEQQVDTFYIDGMDTLHISLQRDGVVDRKVYLGNLVALSGSDKQRFDTAFIAGNILYLSLQRDSIEAEQIDLSPYLDDTDTDEQYADTFEIAGNKLRHSIIRDGIATQEVDLTPYLDNTDNQYSDTFQIVSNQLRHSLIRDGVPYQSVDLSPYLDNTDAQVIDTFSLVGNTVRISLSGDGQAYKSIDLSGFSYTWLVNGIDDVFGSTTISNGNTLNVHGTNGITAKISASGSDTLLIDGTDLRWVLAADGGTNAVIGDAASELVTIHGTGGATTSIVGNTVSINVPVDVDNYVTGMTFAPSTSILTLTRTGALGSLTATVMDHDWYEVGTTRPPDAITDEMFHTGKTGIGMNPVWLLDVAEDARINGHQIGTGPYIGSWTNLRFGKDALSSNVSGSYNLAIGAYALDSATTSSENLAIGYRSLVSVIDSASLNIAIGIQSMEASVTSYDNTAVGHYTLQSSTYSRYNTAIGHAVMLRSIAGFENTGVGDYALVNDTDPRQNVAVGRFAMEHSEQATGNTAIGRYSMQIIGTLPVGNTALGFESLMGTNGSGLEYNIAIGYKAAHYLKGNSFQNILIGKQAGEEIDGDYNIGIGNNIMNTTVGSNNIVLGNTNYVVNASNNVIIGYNQTISSSGNIILANGLGTVALKMLTSGYVGIGGELTPTQSLHVTGNARVTGAYYDSNNDPGTSGQVLSSTVTGTDWVAAASGSGSGTVTSIGLTQPASGITVTSSGTNPITTAGTFTLALNADLLAVENLATNGMVARTATNTWTTRTLTAGTNISITNGDGVSGNPTITNTMANPTLGFSPGSSTILHFVNPGGSTVIFQAGTGVALSATSTTMTISASEVDGNVANEGSLTLAYGSTTDAVKIKSNTAGSTDVTIKLEGASTTLTGTSSMAFTLPPLHFNGVNQINGGSTGINVSAGTGLTLSGSSTDNILYSLTGDALALENLSTTGLAVRTGTSSWTTRSIVAGSGISVSNGDGVSNNITISATGGGTVTSVGITNGGGISVSGSPITSSGSITLTATDASLNNEGLLSVSGTTTRTISSNTSGSGSVAISGAGTVTVGGSANSITITGTGVTSVGMSVPSGMSISGSPITSSGTLALSVTSLEVMPSGLSSGQVVFIDGSSTLAGNSSFQYNSGTAVMTAGGIVATNSPSGYTLPLKFSAATGNAGALTYVDGSGNLTMVDGSLVYYTAHSALTLNLLLKADQLQLRVLPVYNSDAAASSLSANTVYKTSTGELRIKL